MDSISVERHPISIWISAPEAFWADLEKDTDVLASYEMAPLKPGWHRNAPFDFVTITAIIGGLASIIKLASALWKIYNATKAKDTSAAQPGADVHNVGHIGTLNVYKDVHVNINMNPSASFEIGSYKTEEEFLNRFSQRLADYLSKPDAKQDFARVTQELNDPDSWTRRK